MSGLPPGNALVTEADRIDVAAAHGFLALSYWARNIPFETVARAISHSLCVAVSHEGGQVGLARVVTDRATFAYLADVYVLEDHRGRGLARAMVGWLHRHEDLQGLRRWMLMTLDAQTLYESLGWTPLAHPERGMERFFPDVYE